MFLIRSGKNTRKGYGIKWQQLAVIALVSVAIPAQVFLIKSKTELSSQAFVSYPVWTPGETPITLSQPIPLILDSDIGSDPNDAMVYAQLFNHVKKGEANVLGVAISNKNHLSAPMVQIINRWYGYSLNNIPIAAINYQGLTGAEEQKLPGMYRESPFAQTIIDTFGSQYGVRETSTYQEPTAMYRNLLQNASNNSIVILAVGPMTNLKNLLQSGGNGQVLGTTLVAQKVRRLVFMGGKYPTGHEFNFYQDVPSAAYVMANWPTEMVGVDQVEGAMVWSGPSAARSTNNDPMAIVWSLTQNGQTPTIGPNTLTYLSTQQKQLLLSLNIPPRKRMAWDSLATLFAVRGWGSYFAPQSIPGTVTVAADGTNTFTPGTPSTPGKVTYIKNSMDLMQLAGTVDKLVDMYNDSCQLKNRVVYTDPTTSKFMDEITIGSNNFVRPDMPQWISNPLSAHPILASDASAPCYGQTNCAFDTRVEYVDSNKKLNVSVTRGSNYYHYTAGLGWWASNKDIASVSRWLTDPHSPCYGKTPGNCRFTTRTVLYRPGTTIYDEMITVGTKIYVYAKDTGWKVMNHDLASYSLFNGANAPCYGKAAGNCSLTTLNSYIDKAGISSLYADIGSNYYNWSSTTGWWSRSDRLVGHTLRFLEQNGPCWPAR